MRFCCILKLAAGWAGCKVKTTGRGMRVPGDFTFHPHQSGFSVRVCVHCKCFHFPTQAYTLSLSAPAASSATFCHALPFCAILCMCCVSHHQHTLPGVKCLLEDEAVQVGVLRIERGERSEQVPVVCVKQPVHMLCARVCVVFHQVGGGEQPQPVTGLCVLTPACKPLPPRLAC